MDAQETVFDPSLLDKEAKITLCIQIHEKYYPLIDGDRSHVEMTIEARNWYLVFQVLGMLQRTKCEGYIDSALEEDIPFLSNGEIEKNELIDTIFSSYATAIHHDFRTHRITYHMRSENNGVDDPESAVTVDVTAPSIQIGCMGIMALTTDEKIEQIAEKLTPLSGQETTFEDWPNGENYG